MKLDVGCGNFPRGDVNCDLYVTDVENHRNITDSKQIIPEDILDAKSIPNFVLCDAQYLPFKDGAFEDVYCGQVIEHIADPLFLMRELARICSARLVVETVHRFGEACFLGPKTRRWFREHHVSKFNRSWFLRAAPVIGFRVVRWYDISYAGFPHSYLPILRFPYEFGVVFKREKKGR